MQYCICSYRGIALSQDLEVIWTSAGAVPPTPQLLCSPLSVVSGSFGKALFHVTTYTHRLRSVLRADGNARCASAAIHQPYVCILALSCGSINKIRKPGFLDRSWMGTVMGLSHERVRRAPPFEGLNEGLCQLTPVYVSW